MSIRLIASLALFLILAVIASPADAAVAPSRGKRSAKGVRSRSLGKIGRYLRRKAVARHFSEKGMSPEEIEGKLNLLDDDRLYEMSENLDEIDSGQGACEEAIASVIFTYFLIMVFLPFYLLFLMFCEGACYGC